MDGVTISDIQLNLSTNQARKLIEILLHHSKFNGVSPTDTTSDKNDCLTKSYNEIQSFNSNLVYLQKNLHYIIKGMDGNFKALSRMMRIGDQNTISHLSQLNDRMVDIKRSILDANSILDRIMETSSLTRRNFAKKIQIDNLSKSRTQNFVEKKRELPISLSIIKDSTNTEDFNIPDKSLDNVSTGIRTDSLALLAYDIAVRDYDEITSILGEDDTVESLSDSYPDFINRNVSFCESEAPSSLSYGSFSYENSKSNSDSDDVFLTKDDEGLIYFDAEDFELDNNKEQELPDSFEEHSNTESANMPESNKVWINNVELKGEERLFDTFNEYLGTDKVYSENLHVKYESKTLCTIGHYEDNNNSRPVTLTEVSYKVIWNNDIEEYFLVFEEQGSMKSKFIVRINNNLKFGYRFDDSIILEYNNENQLFNRLVRWTVMFKDSFGVDEFWTLVQSFQ